MHSETHGGASRWSHLGRMAWIGAFLALPLAGCDLDRILDVGDPEFAPPEELETEEGLPVLVAGAFSEFQLAYAGGAGAFFHNEAVVTTTAAMTDEFFSSGTFTTRTATDQRQQQPVATGNTTDHTFRWLQRARRAAKHAADVLAGFQPDDSRIPLLRALEAYTYIALGENFCGAVPISELVDAEYVHGPPLSTSELFQEALARFDDGAGHLAAVGRGRALLNLGRFQDAAAAVAGVPTDFAYFVEHSDNTSRQENQVFNLQGNGRWSIGDGHGGNGLPFRSAMDPRVPWYHAGPGFDARFPLYISLRYPNRSSNVVLADGIEARLIEAEAALQAGSTDVWLGILNDLRAAVAELMRARYDFAVIPEGRDGCCLEAELEPLSDPGDPDARVDFMFRERAFWLFLTGHRLGDLRRLMRPRVFPAGITHKGAPFGRDVAFVIPFDEENNPHYDIGQCNPLQP